jgi:hypothetical protein
VKGIRLDWGQVNPATIVQQDKSKDKKRQRRDFKKKVKEEIEKWEQQKEED